MMSGGICPKCKKPVKNLSRHLRRDRCVITARSSQSKKEIRKNKERDTANKKKNN